MVTKQVTSSLVLTGGLDQVQAARRLAVAMLVDLPLEVVAAAELVVSELVTNALLHGGGQVAVRLAIDPETRLRVEVEDAGHRLPVTARDSTEAMTGRGLALVSQLAQAWGVEPSAAGKVVWAELALSGVQNGHRVDPEMDVEALLASWADDDVVSYRVELGSVPTRLLLDAKEHVDNLVRELTFARAAFDGHEVPAHLLELTSSVVAGFVEARSSIKQQAIAAAQRGLSETHLVLDLPASAADAGEAYLRGLDEADRYARAARLLTLETPPVHRVFRHWYVQSLVDQLRTLAAGAPPPALLTFPERLAEEVTALSHLRRSAERTRGLHEVSAALATALTPEEVARVVVAEGVRVLGAGAAVLAVRDESGLIPIASLGYEDRALDMLRTAGLTDNAPAVLVHGTGEPLWIDSTEVLRREFPGLASYLASYEPGTVALCAVPVGVGHRLGVLLFTFRQPQLFDEDEQRFVLALADHVAVALERSDLFVAERTARRDAEALAERLDVLARVTRDLTGARDVDEAVRIVTTNASQQLGALTTRIYLLTDAGMLRSIGTVGGDAALARAHEEFPVDASLPGGDALRTGRPVVVSSLAELAERYPSLARIYPTERTLLVAPLVIRDHQLGVLSMTFDRSSTISTQSQVAFVTALADTTAQALERALAASQAAAAGEKLAFLADASVALASSLDVSETLSTVARLVVPRLADWCLIHLVQDDGLALIEVANVDPDKVAWAREAAERYPPDPNAPVGVAHVVRTGSSELYPQVPVEQLSKVARDEGHLALLRDLGMSSAMVVPLSGRHGSYGAITLLQSDSGRQYDDSDLELGKDLAHRVALAVEHATVFAEQQHRLAAVSRVAEAAQRAILAEPPAELGPVTLAARYVSAAAEARIGGDMYEVVERPGAVRLLIGDVRGKGLEAVRKATVVLGEFRSAATDVDDLVQVAAQIDRRLRTHLDAEDFVTALIAEIDDDGRCTLASCGHPPALLVSGGVVSSMEVEPSLPLGLGAVPSLRTIQLQPGDRVLLYTDGLTEARDPEGRFVQLDRLVEPLSLSDVQSALGGLLHELRSATGQSLGDDLALLLAEYRG